MASNRKLSGVLKGRSVAGIHAVPAGRGVVVGFDDGSQLTVKTAGDAPLPAVTGRVRAVRQSGTTLCLDLEPVATLQLETLEPTASVMVRDARGVLEYAD